MLPHLETSSQLVPSTVEHKTSEISRWDCFNLHPLTRHSDGRVKWLVKRNMENRLVNTPASHIYLYLFLRRPVRLWSWRTAGWGICARTLYSVAGVQNQQDTLHRKSFNNTGHLTPFRRQSSISCALTIATQTSWIVEPYCCQSGFVKPRCVL